MKKYKIMTEHATNTGNWTGSMGQTYDDLDEARQYMLGVSDGVEMMLRAGVEPAGMKMSTHWTQEPGIPMRVNFMVDEHVIIRVWIATFHDD